MDRNKNKISTKKSICLLLNIKREREREIRKERRKWNRIRGVGRITVEKCNGI